MVLSLSLLFIADGESYNPQNNTGAGNVINAIGAVGLFYTIFGYGIARILTLVGTLLVKWQRRLLVGLVGAAVFGLFAGAILREAEGPTGYLWVIWGIIVLFNLILPLVMPKWILE